MDLGSMRKPPSKGTQGHRIHQALLRYAGTHTDRQIAEILKLGNNRGPKVRPSDIGFTRKVYGFGQPENVPQGSGKNRGRRFSRLGTKAAAMRKIIRENPDISDKEITETLRPRGMRILPMEIYNIRREMAALRAEGIIK